MTQMTAVRVTRHFDASPERVFDAWLDPAKARRFLFATPGGEVVRAEIDPRVGGRFLVVDRRDGVDIAHYGEYLEIDRPRRLVFSFSVEAYGVNAVQVTVEIAAAAGGGADLTLTHLSEPRWADRSQAGWTMIVEALAAALA